MVDMKDFNVSSEADVAHKDALTAGRKHDTDCADDCVAAERREMFKEWSWVLPKLI